MKKILYFLGFIMALVLGSSYAAAQEQEAEQSYVILDIDNPDAVTVYVNGDVYPVEAGENQITVTKGEFTTIEVSTISPYGFEKIMNVTDDEEMILLSYTSWYLYVYDYAYNYESTYKITTKNFDVDRTSSLTVNVDNAQYVNLTRGEGGMYEKLELVDGDNIIKYNPEKNTYLTFSNYDRCFYSVTVDGENLDSDTEEYAYYQIEVNPEVGIPVSVIEVKTQFPDVKYTIDFNYPGDVTENVLAAVYVDDEEVEDFDGKSLEVQAGSLLSLELNPELSLDYITVNGNEKEWYADYETYNFIVKSDATVSVAAHEKATATVSVSTNQPEAIIIGAGNWMNAEIIPIESTDPVSVTLTEPDMTLIFQLEDYSYMVTVYVNGEVVDAMYGMIEVEDGDEIYFELLPYPETISVINIETEEEYVLENTDSGMYCGIVPTGGFGLQFILKDSNGTYLLPQATEDVDLENNEEFAGDFTKAQSAEDAPYWDVYGFDGELVFYIGIDYGVLFIEKGDEYVPNNLVALDNNSGEIIGTYDRMGAIFNITSCPAVFHFQDTPDYTATRYWGPVQEDVVDLGAAEASEGVISTVTRSAWANNWILDGYLGLVVGMVDFDNGDILFMPATPYDVQVAAPWVSEYSYNSEAKELTLKVNVSATATLYNSEEEELVAEETYVPWGTVYTVAVATGETKLGEVKLEANNDFEFVGEVVIPNVEDGEFFYALSATGEYGAVNYVIAEGSVAGSVAGLSQILGDKEDAEIYTVTGIRVSGKNLPAGIYISKGQKIVVR